MPELPEVETTKRGLAPFMEGKQLLRVETRRVGLRYPFPSFALLEGQRVMRLSRRAKYLLIEFETATLVSHLGMSGSYRIHEPLAPYYHAKAKDPKHDHLIFHFAHGQAIYNDPRRFGFVEFLREDTFSKMGIEPLGNEFNAQSLYTLLQTRKISVKLALLDQALVCGLGNIYVCEALFLARISPLRAANEVTQQEAETLAHHIQAILLAAIKAGGSSLQDHAQVSGEMGSFQFHFHVYDRANAPCKACALPLQRLKQGGRSTFYCEDCQK